MQAFQIMKNAGVPPTRKPNYFVIDAINANDNDKLRNLLVVGGEDPNQMSKNGKTALYIACEKNNIEMVRTLLENGADIHKQNITNYYFEKGFPIHAAAETSLPITRLLVENGADVNVMSDILGGFPPIRVAALSSKADIVRFLLDSGADIYYGNGNEDDVLFMATRNLYTREINKMILDEAKKKEKNINNALNKKLSVYASEKWQGWTKSDLEKFDTIFSTDPDKETMKILANDYACCPICLKYIERADACNYMKHNCSNLEGFYHRELYKKYNDYGYISWCTICGRICSSAEHNHFKLVSHSAPKAEFAKKRGFGFGGDPFEKDCRVSSGGGGLPEKLARFIRLREKAIELQKQVGKITTKEALESLIEEAWDAPLDNNLMIKADKIMQEKKFNQPSNLLPILSPLAQPAAAAVAAPNIPLPQNRKVAELLNEKVENFLGNEADKGLRFTHKQPDGSEQTHDITFEGLEYHLETQNKNFGLPEFGRCFMYSACKCFLYPKEIEPHVGVHLDEELFDDYKRKFNNKYAAGFPAEGGKRQIKSKYKGKTKKQKKKEKKQRGGANTPFFTEASNAVCILKKRNNITLKMKK